MGNWYNILVAVDAMESSLSAVHHVGQVAGNIAAVSICLVHVYPEPPPDFYTKGGVREVYQAQRIARAEQIFSRCLEILVTAGIKREAVYCTTHMAEGKTISETLLELGEFHVTCYRTPEKEGRVLDLVGGNPMFMQGYSTLDEVGNLVRILDIIQGTRLDTTIHRITCEDESYIADHLQGILQHFLKSVEAIVLLHKHNFKHGDIRRDHIIVDGLDGRYRWIDFDYDFYMPERPFALDLIGLGNILLFILGRRNYRPIDVLEDPDMGEKVLATLHVNDLALLSRDRIFNLQKLKPNLPKCFNDILLHFSAGTPVLYDSVTELYDDLAGCIEQIYG